MFNFSPEIPSSVGAGSPRRETTSMSLPQDLHHWFRTRRHRDHVDHRRGYRPGVEALERFLLMSSFTVTKSTDDLDNNGNPVQGTLRWAITKVNGGGGGEVGFN